MAPTLFQSASILLSLISSLPLSDAHSHNHGKAHEHLHNLHKRDLVVPSNLPGTWTSSGCYTDNVGGVRTLQGAATADTTAMTDEACIAYCDGKGFNYAGTEYSQECYCGDTLSSGSGQAPAGDCNMACTGNASEACGGGSRLNLFWNHQAAPPPPVVNPGPNGWTSLGCYSEATNGRTLTNGEQTPGGGSAMTVALCTTACSNAGYTLAGVEYGGECYCGNTFVGGGAPATSGCSMTCNGNSSEYCGGPGHLNAYSFGPMTSSSTSGTSTTASSTSTSASTSATSTGSSGWSLVGCYTDQNPRTLLNFQQVTGGSAAMTIELCTAACKSGGYLLAGLEYSGECYCDNSYHNGGGPAPDGNALCNMPCNGNNAEICGGPNRLSVYSYAAPVVAPSWSFTGCYVDQAPRSLLNGGNVPGGGAAMTVELCQAACQSGGYTLAGVEYGGECYCDNSVHNGGGPAPDGNAGCNMPCNGNSSETCGGPNRLDLYTYGGGSGIPTSTSSSATSTATGPAIVKSIGQYNFLGCYTEATGARALQGATYDEPGMSLEICAAHCATFTYFGVEYGTECYCGNTLTAGSVLATTQADCSFICPGNQNEYCGAGNRLEMYQLNGNSTVSSSTTSSTSTSATPTGTGSASGLPAGWKYAGCYTEGVNGRAVAANTQPDNNALTIESCVNTCIGLGYTVAGTEFSSQCFCDNFVSNGGALTADTDCNMGCSGNATEKCGGPNRVSVYATGNLTVYGVPQTQTDNLPGSWQYQGCITDNINNRRSLDWQLILTDTNDATTCLSACSKFGYMAGGMEYGDECYCGDTSNLAIVGSTVRPDSECNDPCAGNRSTICGGGNRISYYTWTGTPLYNWAQPTGYGMGAYEFLIGGVCIPLMTSPAVNGKVTFVEKFGTGEPNSTGAYELDLSFVNDPAQAWRPMHVKTDVFCSAGVTLPDRAGRQINIGGWSGDSTFGVRLYWPDGSPGTPGVRDWQENVAELHLQTGRWYPSAMVMSNGSILVVGGEEGSNGAPVPSLELLPQVGPIMDLEFLRETDPFNLYPFLSVMPSGGILIIYYNQARILDPVTFATIKQLPNLPGAVNHPDGGRTYPLEGTAVLLPQHAPYSDPLTVLVCGGSTPGDSLAIDNCVSTQPDAANPQWVIERMPSQRVISCMTALPDGTYLILNGAHHGVAGFGLAQDPNLNAVLYDPSKDVNSRFSIMANTSVARLYHSEAVLLPDGRVLVSGSDPQDGTHPEEYRVEVFIPPYLLNGLPQPTFAIQNKDWTYGQTVTFTVTSSQGNGIKVSLMGAETSTHGNSMGTRSIFPAVSCAGNTCTLTAPPDANTCPPGWFQMFVLDGPTPSHSTWVRIGGDPGQLGNWPPFSDFDKPGLGPV